MKKYIVILIQIVVFSILAISCDQGQASSIPEEDAEIKTSKESSKVRTETEATSNDSTLDADEARGEIVIQRMKRRQFDEEDQREANSKKASKTYKCLYCNNEFTSGVDDKCMIMKDSHGNRIETGFDYLVGAGPAFCSQSCFDRFHEHKHEGHDVIY